MSRKRAIIFSTLYICQCFLLTGNLYAAFPEPYTTRVSVDSSGTQAENYSEIPSISANGRFITFTTAASNLVPGDTNGVRDIFVHDLKTGETSRVSVNSDGEQANNFSNSAKISSNGRYVVFYSTATNLLQNDTNGTMADIYLHDRVLRTTELISKNTPGTQGNGASYYPEISDDARFVTFFSSSTNLEYADLNGEKDVFLHDRQTGKTVMISIHSDGSHAVGGGSFAPSISGEGRFITFHSDATNLVDIDTNNHTDIFVHDTQTSETTMVSLKTAGGQVNNNSTIPRISKNGRYVVFQSLASNVVAGDTNGSRDVFVHDRLQKQTTRISVNSNGTEGNNYSSDPSISDDGRFVSFSSDSTNLVVNDTNGTADIFIRDLQEGKTVRVSLNTAGEQGNGSSTPYSVLSENGDVIVFESHADNLVKSDTNSLKDIFVRGRLQYFPWPNFLPAILNIKKQNQ